MIDTLMANREFPFLEIKEVIHRYNNKKVLDIPCMSFTRGKIYAVVGPNGSGKTTLLTILGLLLKPTSGKVLFESKDVYAHPHLLHDVRTKMTTVIQNPILFDMTVEKNIEYGLKIRGTPLGERKRIVKDCLEMVRLDGFQKRRARELSGGEAQRAAIARALAIKPQVMFLDEYTSNVDEKSIEVLNDVIAAINHLYGSTIFLVTHDTQQAYNLADEVITIFGGMLVQSSMQNLFKGRVASINDLSIFDTGKIKLEVVTSKEGSVHAAINPQDIIVSLAPLSSSARNSLYGMITEVFDDGVRILLAVKAGEDFKVKMTRDSFQEMKLTVGSKVYITFKSTAVEVF
jgi:tungstate transport system ATP-binding protein